MRDLLSFSEAKGSKAMIECPQADEIEASRVVSACAKPRWPLLCFAIQALNNRPFWVPTQRNEGEQRLSMDRRSVLYPCMQ